MFYERLRVAADTFEATERLWRPVDELAADAPDAQRIELAVLDTPAASGQRWYAAIDEIIGTQCKMVFASWPSLDRAGRLVFEGDTYSSWYPVATVRSTVDQFREPTRSIRIGDVFAIDSVVPGARPRLWRRAVDISGPARRVAKIAASAARTGPAPRETRASVELLAPPETTPNAADRPVPGSVAGPVI